MADTLKYIDEALAGVPDNTSGLVTPQDVRELALSGIADGASLYEYDPFTIPFVGLGVPVDIPLLLPSLVSLVSIGWLVDVNGHLVPDWPASIIVPVGHTRALTLSSIIVATKQGGGTGDYAFRFTKDGTPLAGPGEVITLTTVAESMIHAQLDLNVISDAAVYSITAEGIDSTDDLDITEFQLRVEGGALLTDPTP